MSYDFNVNIKLVMPTGWEDADPHDLIDENSAYDDPYFEVNLLDETGAVVEGWTDAVAIKWMTSPTGEVNLETQTPKLAVDLGEMQRWDLMKEHLIRTFMDNVLDLKAGMNVVAPADQEEEAPA